MNIIHVFFSGWLHANLSAKDRQFVLQAYRQAILSQMARPQTLSWLSLNSFPALAFNCLTRRQQQTSLNRFPISMRLYLSFTMRICER